MFLGIVNVVLTIYKLWMSNDSSLYSSDPSTWLRTYIAGEELGRAETPTDLVK